MKVYKIAVENSKTGEKDPWLWNVQATDEQAALRASDQNLRTLGWDPAWKSVKATEIGTAR